MENQEFMELEETTPQDVAPVVEENTTDPQPTYNDELVDKITDSIMEAIGSNGEENESGETGNDDAYMEQSTAYRDAVLSNMALYLQDSEIIKDDIAALKADNEILGEYLQTMYEIQVKTEKSLNFANTVSVTECFLLSVLLGIFVVAMFLRRLK